MVVLCNRWWDHVGCKWSQLVIYYMLSTRSVRMWELQEGGVMQKTTKRNVFIANHPKYKSWRSHYDERHLSIPMQILQSQEEIEANCKEKPYFFGKIFNYFFPFIWFTSHHWILHLNKTSHTKKHGFKGVS